MEFYLQAVTDDQALPDGGYLDPGAALYILVGGQAYPHDPGSLTEADSWTRCSGGSGTLTGETRGRL